MSPRELLKLDINLLKAFRALREDGKLITMVERAFAIYTWELPPSEDPRTSWNANCKRQGAKEFIELLFSLGNPTPKAKAPMGMLEPEDKTQ